MDIVADVLDEWLSTRHALVGDLGIVEDVEWVEVWVCVCVSSSRL